MVGGRSIDVVVHSNGNIPAVLMFNIGAHLEEPILVATTSSSRVERSVSGHEEGGKTVRAFTEHRRRITYLARPLMPVGSARDERADPRSAAGYCTEITKAGATVRQPLKNGNFL